MIRTLWSRDIRSAASRATPLLSGLVIAGAVASCGSSSSRSTNAVSSSDATSSGSTAAAIKVVAAENEYGNVASQIGGRYVSVRSVESNPNIDPHTYEVSPGIAQEVSGAQVLLQNGVGYDDWMTKIVSASRSSTRQVLNVQHLLGLADSTPNPHLWYAPTTMPKVASALAADLAKLEPAHAAYFKGNVAKFDASLKPWVDAIAAFKAKYAGTPVATTEPVADYLLEAMGVNNLTPFSFQADVMNGTEPSPKSVSNQNMLFSGRKVKVFVHNQQVTSSITEGFVTAAKKTGIPIVGAYETMPTPGYTYETWMLAEVHAIQRAVADKISTGTL